MSNIVLWGFDGSTYVRTIKMQLAEKGVSDFTQIPLNVLAGEPRSPAHLARHPFGKVPVLDHDSVRVLETSAITRYLENVLPGPSLIPGSAFDQARMDMVVATIDSYGYGALIGGVAAFHLFAEFIGGQDAAARNAGLATGRTTIEFIMRTKGSSPFIAGDLSLADLFLAPIAAYVTMTPDRDVMFSVPGFTDWWQRVRALASFSTTQAYVDKFLRGAKASSG